MDIETVIGRVREAPLGRRRMTVGPGSCERPGGDAGWVRGRRWPPDQVTMDAGMVIGRLLVWA